MRHDVVAGNLWQATGKLRTVIIESWKRKKNI